MMAKLKALTIDNGGSELRVKPIATDNRVKKSASTDYENKRTSGLAMFSQIEADDDEIDSIIKCPGPFYKINAANFRDKEVANKFHIINVLNAPNKDYLGYFGVGSTAQMYSGSEIELDSQRNKTNCTEFYQRFVFGLALGLISDVEFDGIENGWEDDEDMLNKLTEEYKMIVVTNIPIKEYSGDQDLPAKTKGRLAGSYSVEFPMLPGKPVLNFKVEEQYCGILPEGGVVINSMKKKIGEDEYTLLIDMGHVTDDLAIYKGTTLLGNYVKSSGFAGSTLLTRIQSVLTDAGHIVNKTIALQALNYGTIPQGKKTIDVSDIVAKAKNDFVTNCIKPDLIELFNGTGIKPRQISNIVPIGASLSSNAKTGYMPYEIKKVVDMEDAELLVTEGNVRYANINSAYPYTQALLKAAMKREASN